MLSIGVMVPTKNSVALLPEHLAAMRRWVDLAQEVVVVDSFSTDGTLDLLKANLGHPRVTFLQHPPGLYESWNYGLSRLTAKYAYIATIGDVISREGLQRLFETAQSLGADVVLSKPHFRDTQGRLLRDISWPIDDIIRTLGITQPRRLAKLETVLFALTNLTAAMTGSCASDLFRTEMLQRHPFPCGFGTAGDGPWGIERATDAVWAVVPERFSTFLKHASNASPTERVTYANAARFDDVARHALAAARNAGSLSPEDWALLRAEELLEGVSLYLDRKAEFDDRRRSRPPWILQPQAWHARSARNRAFRRLDHLKSEVLQACAGCGR
jgi:hypothetical protein